MKDSLFLFVPTFCWVESATLTKHGRPEWTRTIDLFRVKEAL
jgi:hypothetical protein